MPTVALAGTHEGGTTEDFGIRARSRPRWMCVDWAATDIAVFPKSVTPQRVRENSALFRLRTAGLRHRRDHGAEQGRGRSGRAESRSVRLHPALARDSRGSQSGARNLGGQRGALAVAAGDAQLAAQCLNAVLEPDESGSAAGFGAAHPIVCHQEAQMVVV